MAKTKSSLSQKMYVRIEDPGPDQFTVCTDDIEDYGYADGEVWGEYELVRKVKVHSNFTMEATK